jgi:polyvinyl alcohol dehydrogenase (cytochrome)
MTTGAALTLLATSIVLATGSPGAAPANSEKPTVVSLRDWPTYGHDAQHTFHAATTLTPSVIPRLRKAWKFRTGDAVTATPTVVAGAVYVGSWDGYFYAIDLRTGALRWKFHLDAQPAVLPQPGVIPRPNTSDGGLVTSSAWFEPGTAHRPDLVVFGAGYTLYALRAQTGELVWKHAYTGRPDLSPDPVHDGTRIFSSPVVADGKVMFGVSVDGAAGYRGYVAAASLATGDPVWVYETDVNAQRQVLNDGCGSVWSSGTVLPRPRVVVFDTADCKSSNAAPYAETIMALAISDGRLVWMTKPPRADVHCDIDFGATVNAGLGAPGQARFLGVGGKDGTYYALDPTTGALTWATNVVFGGSAGGFIGTAAYDGQRVYGSTALGDVEGPCDPTNPRDTRSQEPTLHVFDARTGSVVWESSAVASFAPTTVAGGMVFSGVALSAVVQIRDATRGTVLGQLKTSAPCWSGIAVSGDAVVLGTGTSYKGYPDGVMAFTPGGAPPWVSDRMPTPAP